MRDLVVYQRLVDLHLEVNSLTMAGRKNYLKLTILEPLLERYEECGRMLRGLELALLRSDARSRK